MLTVDRMNPVGLKEKKVKNQQENFEEVIQKWF